MTYRQGRFWQPDVTVATVVERDGRYLVVEERVRGELVINQPAGHLEPGESIHDAALRETLEETGWTVELTQFLGAFQWEAPPREPGAETRQYLRFAFVAQPVSHDATRTLDEGIERAVWMTPEELQAASDRLRSPLVLHVLNRYLAGEAFPLSLVGQLPA